MDLVLVTLSWLVVVILATAFLSIIPEYLEEFSGRVCKSPLQTFTIKHTCVHIYHSGKREEGIYNSAEIGRGQ